MYRTYRKYNNWKYIDFTLDYSRNDVDNIREFDIEPVDGLLNEIYKNCSYEICKKVYDVIGIQSYENLIQLLEQLQKNHEYIRIANYILDTSNNMPINSIDDLFNSSRTNVVLLKKPINVYILYNTAWVNDDDWLNFRDDVYNIDDTMTEL